MKRAPRGSYGSLPATADTLGKRLRVVRMAWKWSQAQFAEAIHSNQKTLSHWERDRQLPNEATLGAISQLLGLSPESLRTGKDFQVPPPPRKVGDMLVSDRLAASLVNLPPVGETGMLLMQREDDRVQSAVMREVTTAIRKAREENRPVWVIIG